MYALRFKKKKILNIVHYAQMDQVRGRCRGRWQ